MTILHNENFNFWYFKNILLIILNVPSNISIAGLLLVMEYFYTVAPVLSLKSRMWMFHQMVTFLHPGSTWMWQLCLTWESCRVSSQPSRAKHTVSLHWGHTQTRSRIVCTTTEECERERCWMMKHSNKCRCILTVQYEPIVCLWKNEFYQKWCAPVWARAVQ